MKRSQLKGEAGGHALFFAGQGNRDIPRKYNPNIRTKLASPPSTSAARLSQAYARIETTNAVHCISALGRSIRNLINPQAHLPQVARQTDRPTGACLHK